MVEKKSAPKETLLGFDFNNVMAETIGSEAGLEKSDIEDLKNELGKAHKDLMARRKEGDLPFYDLPFRTKELRKLKRSADEIRKRVENFVVLGIGGSALGTKAVFKALRPLAHNYLDKTKRRFPRLFVADNVDPEGFASILNLVDVRHTVFNAISKSGTTAETMSQFLVAYDQIRRSLGKSSLKDHMVVTTDPASGLLRALSAKMGFEAFDIPPGVGGRFTVFTPVGLLPLAVAGVNVAELLRGAAAAVEACTRPSIWNNPAYMFAAVNYLLRQKKGRSMLVMMPYADALADVAEWFAQLWAESLGKAVSTSGNVVNAGQTPIKAVGSTDQHSQLQLYMEGPHDKVVCFVGVDNYRVDVKIPYLFKDQPDLAYLGGKSFSELISAEQVATATALAEAGRPNMTLTLPKITPAAVGYLLFMLEVATVASGYLYDINPLDQPGVELSKKFTYGLMGRPGFDSFKEEFDKVAGAKNKYVVS